MYSSSSIGKKRIFGDDKEWSEWRDITFDPKESGHNIILKRGGSINFYHNYLDHSEKQQLRDEMESCQLYRRYQNQLGFKEPRVHVLLGQDEALGYGYHGVKMKVNSWKNYSAVKKLAKKSQKRCGLQQGWNIGANLIMYRSGQEYCGWHADDTQEEEMVMCVVVEANKPRPVYFRPKTNKIKRLKAGDEELQLFVSEGDAYCFDRQSQMEYEHSLPRMSCSTRRLAIILRSGKTMKVEKDTGILVSESLFGNVKVKSQPKETHSYLRKELMQFGVQREKSISGCRVVGCKGLVLSYTTNNIHEVDNLVWFTFTCYRHEDAYVLWTSYKHNVPVRVYRSCWLGPPFGAIPSKKKSTTYRYDGYYAVLKPFNVYGKELDRLPQRGTMSVIYYFQRIEPNATKEERNSLPNKEFVKKILQSAREMNVDVPLVEDIFSKSYVFKTNDDIRWTQKRKKRHHIFDEPPL